MFTPRNNRRSFFKRTAALGAGLLALPLATFAQKKEKPPQIAPEIVKEWVGVAHSDLERVKALHAEHPTLINACWDQGGGDYETALGAAAHTGRVEIAEYLLAHGARMDVFAAVMLGKRAVFDAFLADDPAVVVLKGPHGLSLEHHARKGGQDELAELIMKLASERT